LTIAVIRSLILGLIECVSAYTCQ